MQVTHNEGMNNWKRIFLVTFPARRSLQKIHEEKMKMFISMSRENSISTVLMPGMAFGNIVTLVIWVVPQLEWCYWLSLLSEAACFMLRTEMEWKTHILTPCIESISHGWDCPMFVQDSTISRYSGILDKHRTWFHGQHLCLDRCLGSMKLIPWLYLHPDMCILASNLQYIDAAYYNQMISFGRKQMVMCFQYVRYPYNTSSIVSSIFLPIAQAIFLLSCTNINSANLSVHEISSSHWLHC